MDSQVAEPYVAFACLLPVLFGKVNDVFPDDNNIGSLVICDGHNDDSLMSFLDEDQFDTEQAGTRPSVLSTVSSVMSGRGGERRQTRTRICFLLAEDQREMFLLAL